MSKTNFNVEVNRKVVVESFSWKMLERLFSQGANLVVQIVLARLLAPEAFGSLAIIVAITNYAGIFVQSGLSTAIIQKQDVDELDISTLLTASLMVAGVFYIGLFAAAPWIARYYALPELKWTLRLLAFILFLNAINSIQSAILSRKMEFKTLFFRTMLAVPISGGVGITMAYMGFGVWSLVAHNLINMLVIVIFMSLNRELRVPLKFSWERAKKLYSFSGKILLTSMVTGFHDTFRTMTIGKKYSASDLAYYDKAYTYSNYITQIVNSSIQSVLLSTFSRKQDQMEALKKMARRSIKLAAFVMFPVLIGFALVGKNFVVLLLTQKWAPCVPYLVMFCILRIPGCMMSVDRQVYYAIGKSGINLVYELGLFALNITTLMITMQYGTMAIAVGATAVELLGGFATCCISSKVYQYSLMERFKDLFHPFFNTLVMTICVLVAKNISINYFVDILIQILIGVFSYVLTAAVTKDDSFYYILNMIKKKKGEH